MPSSRRRRAALLLAPSLLSACATISDACPPVRDYAAALRAEAAEELTLLPPDSAIEQMLADYAVMRAQSRACRR
jgi:hypothetical protein